MLPDRQYEIHPIAKMFKDFKHLVPGSKCYLPRMFKNSRLGCWQCHKIHNYKLISDYNVICSECTLEKQIIVFSLSKRNDIKQTQNE